MAKKMKESGIEWVGVVPEDWNVFPGRKCAAEVKQKNKDLSEKTALRFSYGTIIPKSNFDPESEKYVEDTISNYTVVKPGDLVLNGLNLNFDFITKRVGLVKQPGAMTSAYLTIRPFNFFNSSYLCYLLKSYDEITVFHNMGTGVRKTLKYSDFKYLPILYPELDTQEKIVSYLDSKCSQIDHQIDQQEALIVELEDYKKSLITESVTKGFDPNVEMKDSGIEWIGKIPSHWSIFRGKQILWLKKEKPDESDEIITCFRDGEVTLRKNRRTEGFTMSDKEIGYQKIHEGDLVVHGMDGFAGAIGISDSEGKASPVVIVLESKQNKRYLMYYLRTLAILNIFSALTTGIRQRSCDLRWNKLASLEFMIPPIKEQTNIVNYLDFKCAQIDHQIEKRKELIEKLKEYKSSLIYEVVTGKREVPIDES